MSQSYIFNIFIYTIKTIFLFSPVSLLKLALLLIWINQLSKNDICVTI